MKNDFKIIFKSAGGSFKSIGSNTDMNKQNEYEGNYFYSTNNNRFLLIVNKNSWFLFRGLFLDIMVDSGICTLEIKDFFSLILMHDKNTNL